MKDTPRTDEWETYCDEWYYHLWRLRRKNERGFNDGFHINNGDEAKGLCDLLNNLEAKLTAVTEQRDRLLEERKQWRLSSVCRELVEQRDRLAEQIEANHKITFIIEQMVYEAREQRDRLAEALERILDYQGRFAEEEPESIAREALKSLIPNK